MACLSLDATTLLKDLEESSTLSFVCEPPQSPPPSLNYAQPSSQIHSSYCLSDSSTGIHVSSPMYSKSYLPNMPNTVFVHLRIEDDHTGVPSALQNKTLLWCVGPPTIPHLTAGTQLETGSIYPIGDGMYREVVACVGINHGRAIVEVATFCDGACGKVRVWEKSSLLVSFQAEEVNMPITKMPWQRVLGNFFASCIRYTWCR
jgi:hypothetical protein